VGEARQLETGSPKLLCRVEDAVALVTLNDPERRNPLGGDLRPRLRALVDALADDAGVRCLLLTGAGRAFCSGGDARAMARGDEDPSLEGRIRALRAEQEVAARLFEMPKPTLAALPGPAAGAGLSLALACDLRIAAESAFVTTAYARLGLSGDFGGSWFLTRLVGTARARELYFGAERIGARDCERLGLVNRVVPDERLGEEAWQLACRLAAGPPLAYARMKENLNRALEAPLRECLDREAEWMCRLADTEDHREAARAFAEKRPPVFRGR